MGTKGNAPARPTGLPVRLGPRFSVACPETGDAVGHVCDKADVRETNRHLRDVGRVLPEGKHAVMVLEGAGWHRSKDLEIPSNFSLLRLSPCSPELIPIETVSSVLKHRHLANRVFQSADHVRKTVTEAWDTFSHKTEDITRITRRDRARL